MLKNNNLKRPSKSRRLKWNNHSKQGTKFAIYIAYWGRRGRGRMVVGFTTCYAISAYHHERSGEAYSIPSMWLITDRWFSPGTPISSTNTTDCHDITKPLLKVALNTIFRTLYCLYIQLSVGGLMSFYVICVC